MTVETGTRTPDQTLEKPVVYHRTMDGINSFRSLLEPISPPNFWNLGGHFQFIGTVTGSVDLKLDGQHGKTGLGIQVFSERSQGVSFDLDEPLIEGREDENQSHFSHTVFRGGPYDDGFSTDSQRAWDAITKVKEELKPLIPTLTVSV